MTPEAFVRDAFLLSRHRSRSKQAPVEQITFSAPNRLSWRGPSCWRRIAFFGRIDERLRRTVVKELQAAIGWKLNEPTLPTARRLELGHRLSLADAIIAAHAVRENPILLHKDPEFDDLASQVQLEPLPYSSTWPGRGCAGSGAAVYRTRACSTPRWMPRQHAQVRPSTVERTLPLGPCSAIRPLRGRHGPGRRRGRDHIPFRHQRQVGAEESL